MARQEGLPVLAGRMRVVILEQDPEVRDKLRSAVDVDASFSVSAATLSWPECDHQLHELFPELLIARPELIPPHAVAQLARCAFPVPVWLGEATTVESTLVIPEVDDSSVHRALTEAAAEIFRRKACELSTLVDLYVAGIGDGASYLTVLKLQDEQGCSEIPVENIVMITASGNYVHVHTVHRTYEMRETLAGIAGRLSPAYFARVHRSYLINLAYLCELVQGEGESHLILSNGAHVPVGPNYRNQITAVVADKMRMIA
jgi:DNA-binding LytR/AlgR family response regulator